MRKLIFLVFLVVDLMGTSLSAQVKEIMKKPCGNGTEECPYHISNAGEMLYFAAVVNGSNSSVKQNVAAHVVLDNDIDMSTVCSASLGSWVSIGNKSNVFTGVFDGRNHTINNLYISDAPYEGVGLFGIVSKAEISNVTIGSGVVSSKTVSTGALVGVGSGKITNCHNYANITSSNKFCGGLIGYAGQNIYIYGCHNEGNITGTSSASSLFGVGGIAGAVSTDGKVSNCYNLGSITGNSSRVGGIVGSAENCIVTNCFSFADVESTKDDFGGGLCAIASDYYKTKVEHSFFYNGLGKTGQQPDMAHPKSEFTDGTIFNLLNEQTPDLWRQDNGKLPSIVEPVITVPSYSFTQETICPGESFFFDGKLLTKSGLYISGNCECGGDTLKLVVIQPGEKEVKNICYGDSVLFNGKYVRESGIYTVSSCGGDTLVLIVGQPGVKDEETICYGDSILFNGKYIHKAGTYTAGDCDQDTLVLHVIEPSKSEITETIEKGGSYNFGGQEVTESGLYTYTIEGGAENGCDSVPILHLMVATPVVDINPRKHFSPNNDGIEDVWFIENIEIYPEAVVRIYNRWGKLLFEAKGYDNETNAWKGTYLEADCPSTDYWYVIDIESIDQQIIGNLTLVR